VYALLPSAMERNPFSHLNGTKTIFEHTLLLSKVADLVRLRMANALCGIVPQIFSERNFVF
jgi:hypothetical protein